MTAREPTISSCQVLLIEDNPADARLIEELLLESQAGQYEVEWVTTLAHGLRRLLHGGIDVVILDLSLPDSHGLETLLELSAHQDELPIVVLSGFDDERLGEAAVRQGAQDYLVKGDVSPRLLAKTLRYAQERKRAERKIREAEEKLRRVQRLEAVGQLAGGIAHDFNNMLSVVLGFTELAQKEVGEETAARAYLNEIYKAGQRAKTLTKQLLAFSRRQILRPRVFQLNQIIADLKKMLRSSLGERINLIADLDPALAVVKADPHQMGQVLINLAVNGRDAMPKGGLLEIVTRNCRIERPTLNEGFEIPAGDYVTLTVRDTGIGIDRQNAKRVFEPFFTTKNEGQGTGLGLATVYGIVKQSQGYIVLDSEPDRGSTFTLYLPRWDGPQELEADLAEPVAQMRTGKESILVVEDDDMVRSLVGRMLRHLGYSVTTSPRPSDGLELLSDPDRRFDLLLTDVIMPEMSGKELVEQISRQRPQLPVLYMSGYAEGTIAHRGVLEPGTPLLQKPITLTSLAEGVRNALDGVLAVEAEALAAQDGALAEEKTATRRRRRKLTRGRDETQGNVTSGQL